MERHELLERLAPLIPPPRAHQVRYHGVLAPCASGRGRVVRSATESEPNAEATSPETKVGSKPDSASNESGGQTAGEPWLQSSSERTAPGTRAIPPDPELHNAKAGPASDPPPSAPVSRSPRRYPWADLLQRVFEVDALSCPRCGGKMRILSVITDADVARRILECLALPTRAPPIERAVDSSEVRFGRDQRAHEQETDVFEFDQRQPEEWDFGA